MSPIHDSFLNLTWDNLNAWAGSRVVSRGRAYKSRVLDPRSTGDGSLVAWVHGRQRYATQVGFDPSGQLVSTCSCPYGAACKHAVALVLVGLDAKRNRRELPLLKSDDERLDVLNGRTADELDDEEEDIGDTDEAEADFGESDEEDSDLEDSDEEDSDASGAARTGKSRRRRRSADRPKPAKRKQILRNAFEAMSKDELIDFVLGLTDEYPEIGREVVERETLKSGKVSKLVRGLRAEIARLTRQPAWYNDWKGIGRLPDYAHVHEQLTGLLAAGYPDEVVALGKELWREGNQQVEQSQDEGETAIAIGECMEIVLLALPESSLPPAEQLAWLVEVCMGDEYSILTEAWSKAVEEQYGADEWNAVAERLAGQLDAFPKPTKGGGYHEKYERERVMRWLITAFERAGRKAEITPLLEREAPITHCYVALVDQLIAARRKDDARRWAIEGFQKTIQELPGIAAQLAERLREIARREEDLPRVAAYRAWEFFQQPGLHTYVNLEQDAAPLNLWPALREAALSFLESGVRPDLPAPAGRKTAAHSAQKDWPLPPLEIPDIPPRPARGQGPDAGSLVDIALHEKRHDDAIRWLEAMHTKHFEYPSRALTIAQAVQDTHPDVAVAIWKNQAEKRIAEVKPAAYEQAAGYLRLVREVYARTGRQGNWNAYLAGLRSQHKPKRKLMEILDTLEGAPRPPKRIIDTR